MERVRVCMLSMLGTQGGTGFHHVAQRVRYAQCLESLWYLRLDLVVALSSVDGEAAARRKLAPLNALFNGALPAALTATPTRHHAGG